MTKHNSNCKMAFGRKDPSCIRCQELLAGAEPRAGWQKYYYENKKRSEEMRSRSIKEHFKNHDQTCDYARRGVPCVAFDN